MGRLGLRSLARYAHRAVLFGALPSRDGARFLGRRRVFVSMEDNRGLQLRHHAGVLHPLVTYNLATDRRAAPADRRDRHRRELTVK